MDKIYVRRSTAALLTVVALLTIVCVGLVVALFTPRCVHFDNTAASEDKQWSDQSTTTTAAPSPKPPVPPQPWEENYRLPRDTYPLHYKLYLHPDLDTGLFSGRIRITISVRDTRTFLVVHTKFLNVTNTTLLRGNKDGPSVPIQEAFEYEPNEFWVVRTVNSIHPSNYTLALDFNGNLTKSIVGLYRSVYTRQQSGEKRYIATSKFQPTYARRAFPCFDEPSYKSTFETTLIRPSTDSYIALSNMPLQEENSDRPRAGLTEVVFRTSVPMVTYLACFIVCDFTFSEKTTAHGTQFRVYATPSQLERTRFALDIGANITDFFEDYFRIKYPLPKQDMIAIPDFVSGAMEHWGLITYRETALLYDPAESSSFNQQRVASVISHELAHQWFGNLVTLEWWNDLWLNEGFASYIEYKGVAQYLPEWDIESQFVVSDLQRVLEYDAKLSSHPIVQKVDTPDQITEIFDIIAYSKGASVLRMLENFMGESDFREGLSNFLRKFSYANAVTEDLWKELEATSRDRLDITDIMNTWTRQTGYPVLVLTRHGNTAYTIRQERFLVDPTAVPKQESPYNYRWEVPITYFTSVDSKPRQVWLHRDQDSLEIEVPASASWVKFNSGHYGYYRVQYDQEGWEGLTSALLNKHTDIGPSDRAGLINDAFSLAEAGRIPYVVPLGLTRYLKDEKHYVPWEGAQSKLRRLATLLRSSTTYTDLRKYLAGLVSQHFTDYGWTDEGSHLDKLNRINILGLACSSGHQKCLQGAGEKLAAWITNSTYIPPNLRTLVYKYGMDKSGGAEEWDVMWKRYLAENNAQERLKLMKGLASVREPWLLHRFIELAENESHVRSQDYFTALRYISANPVGTPIVWDFVRRQWTHLADRFSLNNRYLGRLIPQITNSFTTDFQLEQMEKFFQQYPNAGAGTRSRKSALENVRNNILWLSKHEPDVADWLRSASV